MLYFSETSCNLVKYDLYFKIKFMKNNLQSSHNLNLRESQSTMTIYQYLYHHVLIFWKSALVTDTFNYQM